MHGKKWSTAVKMCHQQTCMMINIESDNYFTLLISPTTQSDRADVTHLQQHRVTVLMSHTPVRSNGCWPQLKGFSLWAAELYSHLSNDCIYCRLVEPLLSTANNYDLADNPDCSYKLLISSQGHFTCTHIDWLHICGYPWYNSKLEEVKY